MQNNECRDEAEISSALTEFSNGKAFIVAYLRQKLQCWETFPWKLAALNCSGPIAQQTAQEAIVHFDELAHKVAEQEADLHALHHRLTMKFFMKGTQGRQELEAFVHGTPLADLPTLSDMVYGLRFLPVVERVQEAEHAITKKHTVHRGKLSAPFISCRLRIAEIRSIIEDSAELPRLLAQFQEFATSPDLFAKKCGIGNHVLWQEAERRKFEVRLKWHVLASILYSMDPESQYTKTKAIRKDRQKKKAKKEQRVKAAMNKIGWTPANQRWSFDNMERHAMAHHLQSKLVRGSLYSLSHVALRITGLKESLQRRPGFEQASASLPFPAARAGAVQNPPALVLEAEPDIMMLSASDVHADAEGLQTIAYASPGNLADIPTLEHVVFLRLVHSRIAHLKGVSLPAAESQRLQPTDICVTLHRGALLSSERGERRLCVGVDPEAACGLSHEVSVLSLCSGSSAEGEPAQDLHGLKESMRHWTHDSELLFVLQNADISAEASALLKAFVFQNAFPQCSQKQCVQVTRQPKHIEPCVNCKRQAPLKNDQ